MRHAVAAAALLAALSGCAVQQPRGEGPQPSQQQLSAWSSRSARLETLEPFEVAGRVASSALGFKADLRWKQEADGRFRLRVAGPFGARAAELVGDARQVMVRSGDDPGVIATDPELWLEQALGARIPVNGLRWWARGLPAPDAENSVEIDTNGRATRIVQSGWDLSYVVYLVHHGMHLPRRIEASNGDTRVVLVIDRWSAPGATLPDAQPEPEPADEPQTQPPLPSSPQS